MMTEKQLEQRLVKAVKDRGGVAYKFVSPGQDGVPDRLIVLPGGKVGFVEVKKPGKGRLRKIQRYQLKRLVALGCKCFLLDDPDKIYWLIDDIENGLEAKEQDLVVEDLLKSVEAGGFKMVDVYVNREKVPNVLSVNAKPKLDKYKVMLTVRGDEPGMDKDLTFMAESWFLDNEFKFWITSKDYEEYIKSKC